MYLERETQAGWGSGAVQRIWGRDSLVQLITVGNTLKYHMVYFSSLVFPELFSIYLVSWLFLKPSSLPLLSLEAEDDFLQGQGAGTLPRTKKSLLNFEFQTRLKNLVCR